MEELDLEFERVTVDGVLAGVVEGDLLELVGVGLGVGGDFEGGLGGGLEGEDVGGVGELSIDLGAVDDVEEDVGVRGEAVEVDGRLLVTSLAGGVLRAETSPVLGTVGGAAGVSKSGAVGADRDGQDGDEDEDLDEHLFFVYQQEGGRQRALRVGSCR